MLSYQVKNHAKVKFFDVSIHTRDAFKESMQKDLQYGFPNIIAINSLNGVGELDTLAMNFLENDILNLTGKFKPLTSANTVSNKSSDGGRPEVPDSEISDAGDKSRSNK